MRTVEEIATGDWSYREARKRLVVAGRRHIQRHPGSIRLDDNANTVVDCGCGWTGDPLGWAGHLDGVVRASIDGVSHRPAD